MSIETLVAEIERNPDFEVSSKALLPHIDSPEFFDGFIRARGHSSPLGKYKKRQYEEGGDFLDAIREKRDLFREYLQNLYPTLDDFKQDIALARTLGVAKTTATGTSKGNPSTNKADVIAKCVSEKLVDPIMPSDYAISGQGHTSWYVAPEVVGTKNAFWNLGVYVKNEIGNLDDLKGNKAVGKINAVVNGLRGHLKEEYPFLEEYQHFGSRDVNLAARACVEFGFIDPVIPMGHNLSRGRGTTLSAYVHPVAVGPKRALKNISIFFEENFQTLDDISFKNPRTNSLDTGIRNLTEALGEEYPYLRELEEYSLMNTQAISKACIELGLISAEIPDNYELEDRSRRDLSHYCNPKIVGTDIAEANLRKYIGQRYGTLDSLSSRDRSINTHLSKLLEVDPRLSEIARECVNRGILDPELPDGYEIIRGRNRNSFYIDPEVIGREQAEENLRRYIQSRYSHIDELDRTPAIISALERVGHPIARKQSVTDLKAKIAELGWLDTTNFRPYTDQFHLSPPDHT